jgi:hypothetical protein
MTSYAETFGASFGLRDSSLVQEDLLLLIQLASRASLKLLTRAGGQPMLCHGRQQIDVHHLYRRVFRAGETSRRSSRAGCGHCVNRHDDPVQTWAGDGLGWGD